MPVNKKYNVEQLLDACRDYFTATGRRISFEYAMIDGVNDTAGHANLLADRLQHTGSHVNLIRLNNVDESPLRPSTQENLNQFVRILKQRGINVTVRRRLGSDIDASCGQLRRKTAANS
jgi:23S rRNA (adenine2503-C2)-methyltransferase